MEAGVKCVVYSSYSHAEKCSKICIVNRFISTISEELTMKAQIDRQVHRDGRQRSNHLKDRPTIITMITDNKWINILVLSLDCSYELGAEHMTQPTQQHYHCCRI